MADLNHELADFLRRARASVDPTTIGLPADGRIRRVPGLRREEVAALARVSTDYYTRLEQGRRIAPSASVVDAIASALDLDDAGRTHLRQLIGATSSMTPRTPPAQRPRTGMLQLMDAADGTAALLLGRRTQVLAANRLAKALLTDFDAIPARRRTYAEWMLLDPAARERIVDWDGQARTVVENLRLMAGRDGDDPALQALVGMLTIESREFARWWEQHRVQQRTFGDKHFRHTIVGDLTLQYETLASPGDADQTLFLMSAAPDTVHAERLALLASWSLDVRERPGREGARR